MSEKINLFSLASAPQYKEKVYKLIADGFPKGHTTLAKIPVENEFTLLLREDNENRILFLVENDKVIATTAWTPLTFDFKNSTIVAAGIGLVVTDPKFRKKGYASYLLHECENAARNEGATLSTLWSINQDFYTQRGYILGGFEKQWNITKVELEKVVSNAAKLPSESIKSFHDISKLYEKESIGPLRDYDTYNAFLSFPETYCYKMNDSYAFMGKARDLHNTIHELVGDAKNLLPLLSEFLKHIDDKELYVQLPPQSNMTTEMEKHFGQGQRGAYSFLKILNGPAFVEKLTRAANIPPNIEIKLDEKLFSISQDGTKLFESTDWGHFIQLFMGPLYIEEFEDLNGVVKAALSKLEFPQPYFWGFDSV